MKKTLSILLAVALCFTMFATVAGAQDDALESVDVHREENVLGAFVDAPAEDSWKFQGLNCAVENGFMTGHENKLRPDDSLTRAEMVTMMVRVLGAHANKAEIEHYVDVAMGEWYYEALQSGVAAKLINGSGDKMMPNAAITREQTFTILARAFLHMESDKGAADKFSDAGAISDWAKSATNALIETGVVQGDAANTVRPKANVTRAEFATMLDRIACYMADAEGDYAGKKVGGSVIVRDANVNLDGAVIEGDLYITDAVGADAIDLSNVTVTGRIVIRGGEVNLDAGTTASQVVVGNPTSNTAVKADESVAVEKVVVAENSNDVEIDVSAKEVVINSSSSEVTIKNDAEKVTVSGSDNSVTADESVKVEQIVVAEESNNVEIDVPAKEVVINSSASEVTIKKDAEKVTVGGSDNTVKVESGAKVENVVVDGEGTKVTGSGKVENAVVNGEGATVETPNTNVTDNTPVVTPPATGDDDKPSTGDDDKEDDKEDDKPSTGGTVVGTVPTPSKPAVTNSYIKYGSNYIYDSNSASNVVTFNLSGLGDDVELDKLYIKTNTTATFAHALATFSSNTELDIATIVAAIPGKTHNALVEITSTATVMSNLRALVADAYTEYNREANGEFVFRPLFTDRKITVEDGDNGTIKSSFTGLLGGNETFTLEIITKK